jgi:hypothetical protein
MGTMVSFRIFLIKFIGKNPSFFTTGFIANENWLSSIWLNPDLKNKKFFLFGNSSFPVAKKQSLPQLILSQKCFLICLWTHVDIIPTQWRRLEQSRYQSKIKIVFKRGNIILKFFFRFPKNLIKTLNFEKFKRNTSFYFTFIIPKN